MMGVSTRAGARPLNRRCLAAVVLCALVSLLPLFDMGKSAAQEQAHRPAVLFLYSNESMMPASEAIVRGFREVFDAGVPDRRLLFSEYLNTTRFPGPEHEARMAAFLHDKYAGTRIDLVVVLGAQALKFQARHQDLLFPGASIVFVGVSDASLQGWSLPANATGVISRFDIVMTVDLALALQPDAENLVVITGASEFDRNWEQRARSKLASFEDGLRVTYLAGLPMPDLLRQVGQLPDNTMILFLSVQEDGSGGKFVSRDVADKIAAVANAPVYSVYDTYLGRGIVGGHIASLESMGAESARIALRILAGESAESLPPSEGAPASFAVDWRQLRRWGLSESNLPSGTTVRFKEPSLWDRYREEMIALIAILVVQFVLIAGLLAQARKRRRAEDSLRESEERMSLAAESTNLGLWQLDVATYRIWATEQCRRILGLDAQAPVTRELFIKACHPEDRAAATKTCEEAVAGTGSYEQEYRVADGDGRVRWVLDRARGICDASGRLLRMTGVVIDITERKEAEAALRESEERYRGVVETQTELICRYLPDTTLTFVNDAYCRYFGQTRENLVGTKFIELIPEHSRAPTLQSVESMVAGRRVATMEHSVLRLDGSIGWQQWNDHAIRDADGRIVEIQGIGRDITELKRAEAEARERREQVTHLTRVAILGELSGALAHELNQPLAAILSNAQAAQRLLARDPVDLTELREILGDIAHDDNRAGEVIRRLRELFRRGEAELLPVDINEVVEETLGLAHSEIIAHHVTVATAMAPGLPRVNGDRIQLQQVMLNLILNACEAMDGTNPSERSLRLSTEPHDSDGAVTIAVSDRGRGLPPDVAPRVFEPFYTTKEQGLGLGLSISRSIVTAHGGRLWAANNVDGGTTFFAVLPGIESSSIPDPYRAAVRHVSPPAV
jgi:PAS domain S-box-containing protein